MPGTDLEYGALPGALISAFQNESLFAGSLVVPSLSGSILVALPLVLRIREVMFGNDIVFSLPGLLCCRLDPSAPADHCAGARGPLAIPRRRRDSVRRLQALRLLLRRLRWTPMHAALLNHLFLPPHYLNIRRRHAGTGEVERAFIAGGRAASMFGQGGHDRDQRAGSKVLVGRQGHVLDLSVRT